MAMEDTGCVAWPFSWAGDGGPGEAYGRMGSTPGELSNLMHITVICLDSTGSNLKSDGGGGGSAGVVVGVGLTLAAVGVVLGGIAVRLRHRRVATGGKELRQEGGVKLSESI